MTDLVACLGTGKGTWGGVMKLANRSEFENVFLIVNEWTIKNLALDREGVQFVVINSDEKTSIIRDAIINQLHGRIKGFLVAVNMDSGTGKEHTAMITALMKLGLAFRFVVSEGDSIQEVSFSLEDSFPE